MDRALVSIRPEMFGRKRVVQAGKRDEGGWGGGVLWHCSRTKKITNHDSRISNFHISFRVTQAVCEVPLLILLLGKGISGKRVSEKQLESGEKKKQDCK